MSGAHPPHYKKGNRLYLCIYFPEWSIDVTRRKLAAQTPSSNPQAIVLTTTRAQQLLIVRASLAARLAVIKPMMALQLARALVSPQTIYHEGFDPVRDVEALHTLAEWCLRFSPYVGLDTELHNARIRNEVAAISPLYYGVVLDITGTSKLHGDPLCFCSRIYTLFKDTARVALAPTVAGAWALSRFSSLPCSATTSLPALQDAVHDIPVAALRIDADTCSRLSDVGIYTLIPWPKHSDTHTRALDYLAL